MHLLCSLLTIFFVSCSIVHGECFYPDGTGAPGLVPCNEGAEVSHCCRDADMCLTNGLCFSSGLGSTLRRGCTDKNWNKTACPDICTDDFRQSDAVLTPCGEYGSFCCGQNDGARACCESGNGTIRIGAGEPMCNGTTTVFITASVSAPTATATATSTSATLSSPAPTCAVAESVLADLRSKEKVKGNAMIALAALLGCTVIAFAVAAALWRRERRDLKGQLKKAEKVNIPMAPPVDFVRDRDIHLAGLREQARSPGVLAST